MHVDGKHWVCNLTAKPFNSIQNCLQWLVNHYSSGWQKLCFTSSARISKRLHPDHQASSISTQRLMDLSESAVECIAARPRCYPSPRRVHLASRKTPASRIKQWNIFFCISPSPEFYHIVSANIIEPQSNHDNNLDMHNVLNFIFSLLLLMFQVDFVLQRADLLPSDLLPLPLLRKND